MAQGSTISFFTQWKYLLCDLNNKIIEIDFAGNIVDNGMQPTENGEKVGSVESRLTHHHDTALLPNGNRLVSTEAREINGYYHDEIDGAPKKPM